MKPCQAHRRNLNTCLSRALCMALLAMILVSQANLPTAAAPQPPTASPNVEPPSGLHGSQPWATILCKFADVPVEPDPVSYFEQLLGSEYPGLDHYWREVSYGAINLAGSAVTGWHTLPHPRAHYLNGTPNLATPAAASVADLRQLAEDCVAAAGRAAPWGSYTGYNLVFNSNLDRPRGGQVCRGPEGAAPCYRVAWLWPGWYHDQSIWAHEMGHTFGLQHSSVGEGNSYGNMWDVMSVDGPCRTDVNYGRIGQHPIAYQKDVLGWLPDERIFVAAPDSQATITLEQTAALGAENYLLARIPIPMHPELARSETGQSDRAGEKMGVGRHYYTVEARRRTGYDASLPGDGIIIHEVNLDAELPVRPVDTGLSDGGSRGATTGSAARWLPGQVFQDAEHGIAVAVGRATPTGFEVTIFTGPLPAALAAHAWRQAPVSAIAGAIRSLPQGRAQVNARAAAGPDGSIYAIWTEHADDLAAMLQGATASPDLYFARWQPDGVWSERERVNDDSRDTRSNPALVADRAGNIYAAWVDYRDGAAAIYAAKRPTGGAWGKNVKLSGGSMNGYTGLAIFVDGAEQAHVVWEGLDRCGASEAVLDGEE